MNSDAEAWQSSTANLSFSSNRVDIWRVELDAEGLPEEGIQKILAQDELGRAFRLHFDQHRARYVRGRAALRIILGQYLQLPPQRICFQYENNGKPEIAHPLDSGGLRFNVSNSGGLALIAIGFEKLMGVDIEKIRPMPDLLSIARRFFSTREVQALADVSEPKREEAFFACWTRKESFLKATGNGLSYPLSRFSVSVDPEKAAEFWELEGKPELASQWFLADVFPGAGFRAALAVKGGRRHIARWAFDPTCFSCLE